MKKYEYAFVEIKEKVNHWKIIRDYAEDGWRFVAMNIDIGGGWGWGVWIYRELAFEKEVK